MRWMAGVTCVLMAGTVFGQDQPQTGPEDVAVQKTAERLHFKLPPDWPIEKRGGVMAPIPIEEYLARKFKALEASAQVMEQHVNGLDVRLRVLEEEVKNARQGLRSSEATTSPEGR